MTFERGLDLEAKMTAIGAQSPELDADAVRRTAEKEVAQGRAIWGAVDFGVRWYPVEGAGHEEMGKWKQGVDQLQINLQTAIDSGDLTKFVAESAGSITEEEVWNIVGEVKKQVAETGVAFDDEARQMLAIDLWIRRQQGGKWKKETLRKAFWRVASGQGSKIADVLNRDNAPNCIDVGYFVKALADQFAIRGDIKTTPSNKGGIDHRYFQTDSGKVLDYWWLKESGGLALTPEVHQKASEMYKKRQHDHGSQKTKKLI